MMSTSEKMSLLLVVIAMLVQDAFSTSTPPSSPSGLVATDPFPNIPSELRTLSGWTPLAEVEGLKGFEGPTDHNKLETLALLGLNNLRAANGVNTNLTVQRDTTEWAKYLSHQLCNMMLLKYEGALHNSFDQAGISEHGSFVEFVDEHSEEKGLDEPTGAEVSTTDIVAGVVRNLNKWAQDKMNAGVKKGDIAPFNPDTQYAGFAMAKKTVTINNKLTTYRTSVFTFGDEAVVNKLLKDREEAAARRAAAAAKAAAAAGAAPVVSLQPLQPL
uniref:SCP domain-containing protein n=1 Tax=Cacopsylla melanoneura TaxID=428564 RepID=A0A8D8Y3J7_9HEMI